MKSLVGKKIVLEIESMVWIPTEGNKYFVKGIDSLVLTDDMVKKLEAYEVPRDCRHCVYGDLSGDVYPCSMCDKGEERTDKFEARRR